MRFEVGALCVRLPTAHVVARVRGHPLPRPGAPASFGLGFLRQAVAAGDHEGLWKNKNKKKQNKSRYLHMLRKHIGYKQGHVFPDGFEMT